MLPLSFEDALALYEAAEVEDSPELWARAANAAANVANAEPDNPEASYLAGLCAYFAEDARETRKYLAQTLSLDPSHTFARLYMGHQLFDERRFSEALEEFERIDASAFLAIGQKWRGLKLEELRLCCRLYLNEPALASEVARVIKAYHESPEEDKPVPAEIVESIGSLDLTARADGLEIGQAVLGLAEAEGMKVGAELIRYRVGNSEP